jgi:hypothetical protein
MNSMSFGEYLYVGGFMQKKNSLRTTVIYSKQANSRQQVIQLMKTLKDNSRRLQKTPRRSMCQLGTIVGRWAHSPSAASYSFLRSTPLILTVLGQFIQWWSREVTQINDVAIPCPLLHLPYIYLHQPPPWSYP